VLYDRAITELYAADGLTYASIPFIPKTEKRGLSLKAIGGEANVASLVVHQMNSAWR
jgi:hypothetical protein